MQLENADRLALQVVVTQDEGGNLARHAHQQLVAVAAGELADLHQRVEEDLDVDFDVRGVDPCRVVDEVRVEAAAGESVLDPAALRKAEVAAFTDNFRLQFHAIDA